MDINLTPRDALRYIEEANKARTTHSLIEVIKAETTSRPDYVAGKLFNWVTDFEGPGLQIVLNLDGTWTAQLLEVRSPGVDTIPGYDSDWGTK